MSRRIALVGPRAAGKTTIGALLAGRLDVPFRDADSEIEREWGETIPELMANRAFARAQAMTLARLLARSEPSVVATGGGAVEWSGLETALSGWWVIWLDAPAAILSERLRAQPGSRPSLTGRPLHEEIEALRDARAGGYERVHDAYVETHRRSPDEVVVEIQKLLQADDNRKPSNAD